MWVELEGRERLPCRAFDLGQGVKCHFPLLGASFTQTAGISKAHALLPARMVL